MKPLEKERGLLGMLSSTHNLAGGSKVFELTSRVLGQNVLVESPKDPATICSPCLRRVGLTLIWAQCIARPARGVQLKLCLAQFFVQARLQAGPPLAPGAGYRLHYGPVQAGCCRLVACL